MRSITLKLLIINCIVMVVLSLFFFYQTYAKTNKRVLQIVNQQAQLALQFDLSIRKYVSTFIRPAMYELINEDEFFPETMSTSYVARSIFEDVQKQFPNYIIKFSSDNPRNPLNQAGPEELKIIEKFKKQPQLKQWEGQITIGNEKYFAKFSARRMVTSCARCHGDPKDAPVSLIERYGDKAGFHRKLGDVLGLDTVAIPMAKIIEQQQSEFLKISFLIGIGILLFFTLSILITRYLIINRLSIISKHFLNVAQDNDYRQIQPIAMGGNDEISNLSHSFNIMSERLKASYTSLNDQVNQRTAELQKKIIEHKQSEVRLRQSEEKFKAVFKTSPAVITLTGVEDGIYVDINNSFTKLLGYSPEEVIGKSSIALSIWNDLKDRDQLISGLKKNGLVDNLEAKFKGKNGQIIDGILSARTLDIENKKYLLSVTRDMTKFKQNEQERLKLEIRLQQAQKVESIGTLAGGIAHDFNNILSGIFGYSQLAETHLNEPERAKVYIHKIVEGAQRASSLIQQILTFSRQTTSSKEPLDLSVIIKEVLMLIRSTIPKNIEIKEAHNTRAVVLADSTQIHQVIMNLCTNAYHAMGDDGGILIVRSDRVEILKNNINGDVNCPPGNYLRIEISDTGPGIENTIKEKIFDPYFTTKKTGKGTGLGLAVVNAIVKEHRGFIELNSNLGVGTTFQIYLPAIEDDVVSKVETEKKVEKLPTASERILIVDDEQAILDSLKAILSDQGYQVSIFDNSESALKAFSKNPDKFDLIVTDMTMPRMNGDKLSRKVLEVRADIPIILCTGYHENFTEEKAIKAGIKRYVQKPIMGLELLKIIRDLL